MLFPFRIEEGRTRRKSILLRDIKENFNNLVQNQGQLTVSSIVSVMKTSTSSCCFSKSQTSNKNSGSGSKEWIHNEFIQLIAIWEDLYNLKHTDYSVKHKRNNDTLQYWFLSTDKIALYHSLSASEIEGSFIHTIFQPGLNPYAPFSFRILLGSFLRKYVLY